MIAAWLKARRVRREQREFDRGYAFACVELVRWRNAEETEMRLRGCVSTAKAFREYSRFDDGVLAALRDFKTHYRS